MPSCSHKPAFALVMTLLLLVMLGAVLGQVCRASLLKAVQIQHAQEELQLRWARLSLQHFVLPQAERVLQQAEQRSDGPVVTRRITTQLNGRPLLLVFADEQAKANLNAVYSRRGRGVTLQTLYQLAGETRAGLTVRLRPLESGFPSNSHWPVLGSFAQLFLDPMPTRLFGDAERDGASGAYCNLTLWGTGRVNFHRAGRTVLLAVCQPEMGAAEVQKLMNLAREMPQLDLTHILALAEMKDEQRQAAAKMLTDRSVCHSLLIVDEGGHRPRYHFVVEDLGLSVDGRGAGIPDMQGSGTICWSW